MAMIISSMEKPFCLLDAIIPVDGGQLDFAYRSARDSFNSTQSKLLTLKLMLRAARTATWHLGTVPAFFIVGSPGSTVKAPQCNEKLLAFCNWDGD
jgi:hypothetical protein